MTRFEEEQYQQVDSPIAHETTLWVFFSLAVMKMWQSATIGIKAAFLQGKKK